MAQTPKHITIDVSVREPEFVLFDKRRGEPNSLEEAVQLAVGAASACWENLEGAGVFQSDRALEVSEQLIAWLRGAITSDRIDQVLLQQYRKAIDTNRDTIHALEDEVTTLQRAWRASVSEWIPSQPVPPQLQSVLDAVVSEYWRAKAKHGEMTMDGTMTGDDTRDDALRMAALVEEVGEVAHELTYDSQPDGVEGGALARLIKELVQVANVAATWASYLVPGPALSADPEPEEADGCAQAPFAEAGPSEGVSGVAEGSTVRVPQGMVAVMVPSARFQEVAELLAGR